MSRSNSKMLVIRVASRPYTAEGVADLVLSDLGSADAYNHPQIVVRFRRPEPTLEDHPLRVLVRFQRHEIGGTTDGATGYMDTCRRWSTAYGADIELSRDARVAALRDAPFQLRDEDRVRVELARRLARTIREYNLYLVDPDHCVQVVFALEKLGLIVRGFYDPGFGQPVEANAVEGRGANRRAEAERKRLEEAAGRGGAEAASGAHTGAAGRTE